MKKLTTEQRKDLERKLADITEIGNNIKRLLDTNDYYSVYDYNDFCKSFFIVDPIINNSHDGCMVIKLSTINELFENPINIRKDDEECVINFIKELINEKEFFVITHRYKLNDAEYMTYTELAKELGVSASRIKSIEERAKRIIRRSMPGLKECLLKQKNKRV